MPWADDDVLAGAAAQGTQKRLSGARSGPGRNIDPLILLSLAQKPLKSTVRRSAVFHDELPIDVALLE
jgi:hypothetical protein